MDREDGCASNSSSEDEFEDPYYWQEIHDKVVQKWKKAKAPIKLCKQALFDAHALLKRKETEIQRFKRLLEEKDTIQEGKTATKEAFSEPVSVDGGRKNPLTLFPEEIWQLLLNNVEDAESLENSSLTCQLFANILEPRRIQWLFGKILPIIYHHLRKKDVLNCRQVCKNWKNAVDLRIDREAATTSDLEDPSPYNSIQRTFKNKLNSPKPFPLYNVQFSNQAQDNNVSSVIELLSRNPSLGRSVSFSRFSTITTISTLHTIGLLENCGQYIRYLKIRPVNEPVRDRLQQVLNQYLEKMPNLKTLQLDCELIRLFDPLYSLPTLDCVNLDSLIIQNYGGYQVQHHADELVSALSQQLIRLELSCWSPNLSRAQWKNLKELNLSLVRNVDTLLDLLKTSLPSLKSLKMSFLFPNDYPGSLLCHLLKITNHFGSLNSMQLGGLHNFKDFKDLKAVDLASLSEDLYAPTRLTTLKIHGRVSQGPILFSFLLRFPFLKYLYIWDEDNDDREWKDFGNYFDSDPTGIFKCLYFRKIYKADVWNLLPCLDVITCILDNDNFDTDVVAYTRQGCVMRPLPGDNDDNGADSDVGDDDDDMNHFIDSDSSLDF